MATAKEEILEWLKEYKQELGMKIIQAHHDMRDGEYNLDKIKKAIALLESDA